MEKGARLEEGGRLPKEENETEIYGVQKYFGEGGHTRLVIFEEVCF